MSPFSSLEEELEKAFWSYHFGRCQGEINLRLEQPYDEFTAKQRSPEASWLNIKQLTAPQANAGELISTRPISAMTSKNYVAIYTAKETLEVTSKRESKSFSYTPAGLKDLLRWIRRYENPFVVCEATGGYERELMNLFHEQGIAVALVNPSRVRSFARSEGLKAKTDPTDSSTSPPTAKASGFDGSPPSAYRVPGPGKESAAEVPSVCAQVHRKDDPRHRERTR